MDATQIYARIHGIPRDQVFGHKRRALALLLDQAGCEILVGLDTYRMLAVLPEAVDPRAPFKRPIGLRAALNHCRRAGVLKGLRAGARLPAFDDGRALLLWCVGCGKLHHHGRGGGYGPRAAHCPNGDLYGDVGYTLVPCGGEAAAADGVAP